MTAEARYMDVWELRGYGLKYIDIARDLYPEDYREWERTRSRELYLRLVNRVHKLFLYAQRRMEERASRAYNSSMQALQLDESTTPVLGGGERDPLAHRAPPERSERSIVLRKMNPGMRQFYEYEQLMHRLYRRSGVKRFDPDGTFWATVKLVHRRAFNWFYDEYGEKVWTTSMKKKRDFSASLLSLSYIYSCFAAASFLLGRSRMREFLFSYLVRRGIVQDRELFKAYYFEVAPYVFSYAMG